MKMKNILTDFSLKLVLSSNIPLNFLRNLRIIGMLKIPPYEKL